MFNKAQRRLIHMAQTLIRLPQVIKRTGICRSGIYAKLRFNPKRPHDYDSSFPKPVQVSTNRVAWVESEINNWIEMKIQLRDQKKESKS